MTADLEAHLKRHAAEVKDREARRRAEEEEAAREFAELEDTSRVRRGGSVKPRPKPMPWPSSGPTSAGKLRS